MADRIQIRRDTAANWALANPVLAIGELGFETDTLKLKIGSGTETWNTLSYVLDATAYATPADVTAAIDALVDSAPGTLDTLNELAASLGDDANFASTVTTALAAKANSADLATVATSGAYADVTGTPTLATVATTGVYSDLTGTPTLATIATTGAYSDLTGTPTLPSALTDLSIVDGTAGQVLSADGDGTYTFIDAAVGGSFEAVASGSLSDGSTVVLNADGTVSVVGEVETPGSLGTVYSNGPEGSGNDKQVTMYDSTSGKTVIVVHGGSPSYIGTISLTTFNENGSSSYTPISLPGGFDNGDSQYAAMVSIGNGKFVLTYYSSANNETRAVVGTISGDTITWGTPYVIASGIISYAALTYYAAEDKVVYQGSANFRVGTVSGTDITFGAPTATPSGSNGTLAYFPNRSKAVYIYSSSGATSILFKTFTLDSSGNITLGTTELSDVIGYQIDASPSVGSFYHTGLNKFVFIGAKDSSNYIVSVVVDIDEFGELVIYTPKVIQSGKPAPYNVGSTYDPNSNTYVVYWMSYNGDNGPSNVLHIKEATIDSNTYAITTGPLIVSLSNTQNGVSRGLYIPEIQKSLMLFGTTTGRKAAVWTFTQQLTNLTAENYAGIADAAYADAATATIQTAGSVDDAQSGLTPGQAYYVQANGTLGLTPGTPRVFAGVAASATKLLIGKEGPAADLSSYATETYVDTAVNNLVDTAPEALNTLNELAAALNDDANFAGTVTTSLSTKLGTDSVIDGGTV